jgi:hypothetical protein
MSEIHDFELPTTETPDLDRFTVDNDAKAEWALRKLAALRSKITENSDLATAEIARVQEWLNHTTEKLNKDASYFEGMLTTYAISERNVNDRKTIELPHGKVKSRSVKAKVSVLNAEKFVEWARANNPDLIRIKETPNVSALSDFIIGTNVVTADGEIIPEVQVIPETINFNIETE